MKARLTPCIRWTKSRRSKICVRNPVVSDTISQKTTGGVQGVCAWDPTYLAQLKLKSKDALFFVGRQSNLPCPNSNETVDFTTHMARLSPVYRSSKANKSHRGVQEQPTTA